MTLEGHRSRDPDAPGDEGRAGDHRRQALRPLSRPQLTRGGVRRARSRRATVAALLRQSRWTYPAVNALHVLGVALLVGAIVPMDLRLIGAWRADMPPRHRRCACSARSRPPAPGSRSSTGALLFAVQAPDYAAQPLFAVKMALVAAGLAHALAWGGRSPTASTGARFGRCSSLPARRTASRRGGVCRIGWSDVEIARRVACVHVRERMPSGYYGYEASGRGTAVRPSAS